MAETMQRSMLLQSLLARVSPALDNALEAHPAFTQQDYSFSTPPATEEPIHSTVASLLSEFQFALGDKDHQLLHEVVSNQLKSRLVRILNDAVGTWAAAGKDDLTEGQLSDKSLRTILATLDLSTLCLRNGLCAATAPLDNIEELLEMLPIPSCVSIWTYVEERADELIENLEPGKGKGLILLRLCNDLLRRLSKPTRLHSRLAGRVLSLLAYVFPLGERSGTNFRGDFNVDNITKFDEDWTHSKEATAERSDDDILAQAQSPEFYKLFWNLQSFFSNPALLFTEMPDRYQPPDKAIKKDDEDTTKDKAEAKSPSLQTVMGYVVFKRNLAIMLDVLQAIGKREKELAGAAKAEEEAEGSTGALKVEDVREGASTASLESHPVEGARKRKQSDEDMERDSKKAKTSEQDTEQFFPKFLTGRKVFEYELRDPFFRKHILLQSLIILQFMLGLVPQRRKDNWPAVKNKVLIGKLTSMTGGTDDQSYSDEESAWVKQTWKRILLLIIEASSDGQTFNTTVLQALRHEPTWLRWKDENCPSIYRSPIDNAARLAAAEKTRKLVAPLKPFKYLMGTEALMELWTGGLEVRKVDESTDATTSQDMEVDEKPTERDEGVEDSPFAQERKKDGLVDLENDLHIPTLGRYRQRVKAVEMRAQMRRKQLTNQAVASAQAAAAAAAAEGPKEPGDTADANAEPSKATPVPPTLTPNFDSDSQLSSLSEAKYSLTWRALRLARSTHLHLFPQLDIRSPDSIEQILEAEKKEKEAAEKRARGEISEEEAVKVEERHTEALITQSNGQAGHTEDQAKEMEMPPPAIPAIAGVLSAAEQAQPTEEATSSSAQGVADVADTAPPSQADAAGSEMDNNQEETGHAEEEEEAGADGDEQLGSSEEVAVEGGGLTSGPSTPHPEDGVGQEGGDGDGDEEMTSL